MKAADLCVRACVARSVDGAPHPEDPLHSREGARIGSLGKGDVRHLEERWVSVRCDTRARRRRQTGSKGDEGDRAGLLRAQEVEDKLRRRLVSRFEQRRRKGRRRVEFRSGGTDVREAVRAVLQNNSQLRDPSTQTTGKQSHEVLCHLELALDGLACPRLGHDDL